MTLGNPISMSMFQKGKEEGKRTGTVSAASIL
jgi:hypothetical protein